MGKKIKAVILDWAGTTVDFGSMAPVAAFRGAFGKDGLSPGDDLIRRFMGLPKKDHVRNMLHDEGLVAVFEERHGKAPDEADVERIYGNFEPALLEVLTEHARPLPGVPETVARLREAGISIGSTTGYTRAMMEVLCPVSEAHGYAPDCLVCPDDVGGAGRPYPYMLWENLRRLGIESVSQVIKIGDTAVDILEGKNAGCLSVGVVFGSNMLGLSEAEYKAASQAEKERAADGARRLYAEAGADHIIGYFTDIPKFIEGL
ncbi:MAG: phosphonoacetaldehyde hydrolase [Clostridiales bacterium]|nr:phosphonoacetaldehyde hydrolase [Clostridiales bacterium]